MLAERRRTPTTPAALAVLGLLVLGLVLSLSGPARADFIGVTTNPDASRTAIWNLNSSAGLTASNLSFTAKHAELSWVSNSVTWPKVADLSANGTTDANATALTTGIGLVADSTNHVANPGFDTPYAWNYTNGTARFLNATWNATAGTGMFSYSSLSTLSLWGAMDYVPGWLGVSFGDTATASRNTTCKTQGSASIALAVLFTGVGGDFAGLLNQSTSVDWSSADRLVLSVYLNASAPAVVFNVSARDASLATHYTAPQKLVQGWQNLTVDLDQLGIPSSRNQLSSITLRVSSTSKVSRTILFDNLRIGAAKVFSDAASIRQSIAKVNLTTADAGSATLGLSWSALVSANVASNAVVSISGPSGTYEHPLANATGASYFFTADISATTALPGTYTVNVSVSISSNTTAASDLTFLVDNVALYFPHRQNGTYTTRPIALGNDSAFDGITWTAATPAGTSTELAFRIQANSILPGEWGSWSPWSPPGTVSLGGWTGVGIQIHVALNTTNASLSAVLESVEVTWHHRAQIGSVVAGPFTATDPTFLWWRNLTAIHTEPGVTAVQFYVSDGTSWTPIVPGDLIKFIVRTATIYWRADLVAYDTLQTPTLSQVNLTYDYQGPAMKILIYPGGPVNVTSGQNVTFAATAWDAGWHSVEVPSFGWVTTDTTGGVSANGTYHAGLPGNYTVTAYLPTNPSVLERVQVHVLPAGGTGSTTNGPPLGLSGWWPYLVVIAAIGVGGFALYEFVIRRLFSIDDVFLISRDGRLMMHNTRRMRADRDEDILSGMLTAIMSFLRDQDPEENGELKQFKVGGKTTLLERGKHAYLAAVYSGRVPRWAAKDLHRFMEDLDAHFGESFSAWNGDRDDLVGLRDFTGRFARNVRYRRSPFRDRAA